LPQLPGVVLAADSATRLRPARVEQLRDAWLTRSEVEQHLEQRTLFDRNGKITSIPQLQ